MKGWLMKRFCVEVNCFEAALRETNHPSYGVFFMFDLNWKQAYISAFARFRKTDSQHNRAWRLYRAKLLTEMLKGNYDPVNQ